VASQLRHLGRLALDLWHWRDGVGLCWILRDMDVQQACWQEELKGYERNERKGFFFKEHRDSKQARVL
jgi:hypothetical protein